MILRRFTQHVKNENWFAVSIDFFVVVVGIFIGMQVTEWNQDRKDRIEEREYIERLQGDVEKTIALLETEIKEGKEAIVKTGFVLNAVFISSLLEEDKHLFDEGLNAIGQTSDLRILDGTFIEMQSTGKLSLIKSEELREAINTYDEAYRYAAQENNRTAITTATQFMEVIKYFRWNPSYEIGPPIYDFNKLINGSLFYNHLSVLNGGRRLINERIERVLVAAKNLNEVLKAHLA